MVALSGCSSSGGDDPVLYDRIVVQTFDPWAGGSTQAVGRITLFDPSGVQLDQALQQVDYIAGLSSGTYYASVEVVSHLSGPYGVRVLSLALGDSIPAAPDLGTENPTDAPYEDDNASPFGGGSPNPATLDLGTPLNRYLGDPDTDWHKIVLP